ncbi:hypothetical protein [Alicyclobacillus mengziensis]|uniref:Uncharacterized protein n=1 Tax=Alicyclobacillus mengziensis TaxID=2931921 RepID=A0A9X7Z8H9_9BACL|nr:hypothetical protein [Alicyclobacillus mengziensis]QSO48425.1 hypothetical protein JZ786_05405 [Alicyclobacillus mengziensis]
MRTKSRWGWLIALPLITVLALFGYWVHQYATHATPEKAQATYNPHVGPFETVKFAKGVVLFTPSGQGNSFTAWYMTKNFGGWHVSATSQAAEDLSPHNYNVDFEPFTYDGQTFVWGTAMLPIKEIVYHHNGKTFTAKVGKYPVWYMVLPFKQTLFPHSEWTMVLPNGKTAPLFK